MRSKSGSAIFLRRNPEGSFIVLVWVFTSVFSAAGADAPDAVSDVFPSGVSVSASSGSGIRRTLANPKELVRQSSDASILRRLRYGNVSEVLLRICQFLLMNPWYNVFKIECSFCSRKACMCGFMF